MIHYVLGIAVEQQKLRAIRSSISASTDRAQILQTRLTKVEADLKRAEDEKKALVVEKNVTDIRLRALSSENDKLKRLNEIVMAAKLNADEYVRSLKLDVAESDDKLIIEKERVLQLRDQLEARDKLLERIRKKLC